MTHQKLKGILVISLDSGICLFSEACQENYGFSIEKKVDPMQLSSTLFALDKLSVEHHDSDAYDAVVTNGELQWIAMVNSHNFLVFKSM